MPPNKKPCDQSGNVFIIILVGIALFAALSVVVSRSMRTESAGKMTEREAALIASEILDYGQNLGRGVDRVRRKGCSENDISFANDTVSGHEHTPVVEDKCRVFHPDGGAAVWRSPPEGVNDGSEWEIIGRLNVLGVGDGVSSCAVGETGCADLIVFLPNVELQSCIGINKQLGIVTSDGQPSQQDDAIVNSQFIGDYAMEATIEDAADENVLLTQGPVYSMCTEYSAGGTYFFYHVLLAR